MPIVYAFGLWCLCSLNKCIVDAGLCDALLPGFHVLRYPVAILGWADNFSNDLTKIEAFELECILLYKSVRWCCCLQCSNVGTFCGLWYMLIG